MLEKIRIILVEPSHMGNIGSTARAMMNMGLSSLYLVNPKKAPDIESHQLASGASELLSNAIIVDSLDKALENVGLVIGTSARTRKISLPIVDVRTASENALTFLNQSENTQDVAVLFGRERTGLYNEEILMCHKQLYIPTNEKYNSLNLAQAVQIIAYEFRMAHLAFKNETEKLPEMAYAKKATAKQYQGFYQHLEEVLIEVNFLDQTNPGLVIERLKRIFQRSELEEAEVNLLRGILKQVLLKKD